MIGFLTSLSFLLISQMESNILLSDILRIKTGTDLQEQIGLQENLPQPQNFYALPDQSVFIQQLKFQPEARYQIWIEITDPRLLSAYPQDLFFVNEEERKALVKSSNGALVQLRGDEQKLLDSLRYFIPRQKLDSIEIFSDRLVLTKSEWNYDRKKVVKALNSSKIALQGLLISDILVKGRGTKKLLTAVRWGRNIIRGASVAASSPTPEKGFIPLILIEAGIATVLELGGRLLIDHIHYKMEAEDLDQAIAKDLSDLQSRLKSTSSSPLEVEARRILALRVMMLLQRRQLLVNRDAHKKVIAAESMMEASWSKIVQDRTVLETLNFEEFGRNGSSVKPKVIRKWNDKLHSQFLFVPLEGIRNYQQFRSQNFLNYRNRNEMAIDDWSLRASFERDLIDSYIVSAYRSDFDLDMSEALFDFFTPQSEKVTVFSERAVRAHSLAENLKDEWNSSATPRFYQLWKMELNFLDLCKSNDLIAKDILEMRRVELQNLMDGAEKQDWYELSQLLIQSWKAQMEMRYISALGFSLNDYLELKTASSPEDKLELSTEEWTDLFRVFRN